MNTEIILHSIMEKMHQITWFMMELEKKEISDNIKISKEQIDNNKFLEKLYQNLQEDYIDLQKYVLYMSYLNNKYNGLLQEGEREKLGIVKYSLRNGNIKTFLNMSEFEIEANISRDYEQLKQELKESIKEIIKEEKRKSQIRNRKNINEKLAKDEKSDAKVEEREI